MSTVGAGAAMHGLQGSPSADLRHRQRSDGPSPAVGDERDARKRRLDMCLRSRAGISRSRPRGAPCVRQQKPAAAPPASNRGCLHENAVAPDRSGGVPASSGGAGARGGRGSALPTRPKPYGVLAEIELAPSRADCSSHGNAATVPSCPQGRLSRSGELADQVHAVGATRSLGQRGCAARVRRTRWSTASSVRSHSPPMKSDSASIRLRSGGAHSRSAARAPMAAPASTSVG